MPKMKAATAALSAAALVASAATPAMAAGLRSGDALPRHSAFARHSPFQSSPAPFRSSSALAPAAVSRMPAAFTPPSLGFGGGGFLRLVYSFLPPRAQQRLEEIITRPGGNPAVCELFGFDDCPNPDSPG